MLVAERQAIGTNGVEGHVAEVEQAGQADHYVQAQAQQHVDQAEDDHGEQVLAGEEREDHRGDDQQRNDPAQPALVVGGAHVHAGAGAVEALHQHFAARRLQVEAEQEAAEHDDSHHHANALELQVETVAIEHHAHDGAEDDEREQTGDDGVDQALLDIQGFPGNGRSHDYTLATCGRPSRPWGRKIRISTSREKLNTSL
ncbi:hypothetical protein D9M72_472830 [compost metagenome]